MNKKNIIIIGATSGIGRALFERYIVECNSLGIVGRRMNLLDELRCQHPSNTYTATADITKQEEAEQAISTRNSVTWIWPLSAQARAKSTPRLTTRWNARRWTLMSRAGRSLLIRSTTSSNSKVTATS